MIRNGFLSLFVAGGLNGVAAMALTVAVCGSFPGLCGCSRPEDWAASGRIIAADISPRGWSEPVLLGYDNKDTLGVVQLTLSLRHSAEAELHGKRFVVAATSPAGTQTRDTLQIGMTDKMVCGDATFATNRARNNGGIFAAEGDGEAIAGSYGRASSDVTVRNDKSKRNRFVEAIRANDTNNLREVCLPVGVPVCLSEAGEWIFSVTPLRNTRGVWSMALTLD